MFSMGAAEILIVAIILGLTVIVPLGIIVGCVIYATRRRG